MISLLILLFLREVTGATFFLQYETKHQTQICNKSDGGSKAAWWLGHKKNSLQKFEQGCCGKDGNLDLCDEDGNPHDPQKHVREHCPNKLKLVSFHGGGVFACKTPMEKPAWENKTPLFSSNADCKDFNFFFVATINSTAEQSSKNICVQSEKEVFVGEKEKFSLSCKFELNNITTFAVYWLKETKPSMCLFSVSNEVSGYDHFDYDVNCCIDEAFKGRRINSSKISGPEHEHLVTITNSIMADSGIYVCVVAAYNKKYRWTIESRVSVSVKPSRPGSSKSELKISLGVIAAMLLIAGIILFLCWKKNVKGKPLECQQRDQTTVATEDCSPYAISSRNDLERTETVYSLATGPGETPPAAHSLPESEATPGVKHGENVEALYSEVLKDRTHPPLASDVGLPST